MSLELTARGGRQIGDLTQKMLDDAARAAGSPHFSPSRSTRTSRAPRTVQEPLGQNISISNDEPAQGLPEDEAKQLETVLNTGALPVNMR